jgi:F-type H+-transporting ATPase subunit delta
MTPNPRLSARYAKAVLDLAIEKGQLDAVYNDMLFLDAACQSSRELVSVLRSPIIKADKKGSILEAITAGKVSDITASFNRLLLAKEREAYLPEIASSFIEQYKTYKGIRTVRLTTATSVSDDVKVAIVDKLKAARSIQQVDLHTRVDESLIGGFVLEIGDELVDASVAFELKNIRKQFQNNDFIYKIR